MLIEHEYGIFGGEAGAFVLSLAEELELPLVVTLHTVLSDPSVRQAETLRALCRRAALVTVFTETARRMVDRGTDRAGRTGPGRSRTAPRRSWCGGGSGRPPGRLDHRVSRAWRWNGSRAGRCCRPSD